MKIHQTKDGKLLAACDKEILGKTFSQKRNELELVLELKEDFYFEQMVEFEELCNNLNNSKMANFVGKKIIAELLNAKKIKEDEIMKIAEIPHIQLLFIE